MTETSAKSTRSETEIPYRLAGIMAAHAGLAGGRGRRVEKALHDERFALIGAEGVLGLAEARPTDREAGGLNLANGNFVAATVLVLAVASIVCVRSICHQ